LKKDYQVKSSPTDGIWNVGFYTVFLNLLIHFKDFYWDSVGLGPLFETAIVTSAGGPIPFWNPAYRQNDFDSFQNVTVVKKWTQNVHCQMS
jgi:hypothetical protein